MHANKEQSGTRIERSIWGPGWVAADDDDARVVEGLTVTASVGVHAGATKD